MKYKFSFFGVMWFYAITLFNLNMFWIEECKHFNWVAMSLTLFIVNIVIGFGYVILVIEKDVDNTKALD